MSFEVVIEELRAAASGYRSAVADLAGYDFATSGVAGDTFGHVELAAWYSAVAEQCDNAGQALYDDAVTLAASLAHQADTYEGTDSGVSTVFQDPLAPLLGTTPGTTPSTTPGRTP